MVLPRPNNIHDREPHTMSAVRKPKGRTLRYSERRAIRDAGGSAYRWFEQTAAAKDASSKHTVTVLTYAQWTAYGAAGIILAALGAHRSGVLGAALVVVVAALGVGWSSTQRPYLAPLIWPAAVAVTGTDSRWGALAALALMILPTTWWAAAGSAAIATSMLMPATTGEAGNVQTYAGLVGVAIATAAATRWFPVDKRAGVLANIFASWFRPPLDTPRLHKPLPPTTTPFVVRLFNPTLRRTIAGVQSSSDSRSIGELPAEQAAKVMGSVGERAVAVMHLGLPRHQWWAAHDLLVPGETTANIDHVLVGPSGLWTLDAKQYKGTITASPKGIHIGSTDLGQALRATAWETSNLSVNLGVPARAAMLVPPGVCPQPLLVHVPASATAAPVTVLVTGSDVFPTWLTHQPPTCMLWERLRIAALLCWRTRPAAHSGRTPHLSLSRGIRYDRPLTDSPPPLEYSLPWHAQTRT